jgi:hypothetical protein
MVIPGTVLSEDALELNACLLALRMLSRLERGVLIVGDESVAGSTRTSGMNEVVPNEGARCGIT